LLYYNALRVLLYIIICFALLYRYYRNEDVLVLVNKLTFSKAHDKILVNVAVCMVVQFFQHSLYLKRAFLRCRSTFRFCRSSHSASIRVAIISSAVYSSFRPDSRLV